MVFVPSWGVIEWFYFGHMFKSGCSRNLRSANGEAWVGLDNGAPVVVVVLAAAACLPLSGVGVRVVWDESAAAVVEGMLSFSRPRLCCCGGC